MTMMAYTLVNDDDDDDDDDDDNNNNNNNWKLKLTDLHDLWWSGSNQIL